MRFLADESVDMAVVNALRVDQHDVLVIAESSPGISDEAVASLAQTENRMLLTEDRDFGRLVYARLQLVGSVLYLRYPSSIRLAFAEEVATFVRINEPRLERAFAVLQPGRARIGRLPEG